MIHKRFARQNFYLAAGVVGAAAACGAPPCDSTRDPAEQPALATFSIVARDPRTGDLGVSVATCLPAVGMMVPHAEAGVGAVANQALVNPVWGTEAMRRLRAGEAPEAVLDALKASDPDKALRQIALVDRQGHVAAYTGSENLPWAGHLAGDGFAVAGNILVGSGTLEAMADAFRRMPGGLPERLLAALEAGDLAGGDTRGKQSAALLVVRKGAFFNGKLVDLRCDDHAEPVRELGRLYEVFAERLMKRLDVLRPAIVRREAWGAQPPRGRGTYRFPERITFHDEAANGPGETSGKDAVRRLQRTAQEGCKAIDIPYHFVVDGEGWIFEGRPPFLAGGTDAGDEPAGGIRVAVLGDFQEERVGEEQAEAAARLAAWLVRRFGIPPEAIRAHPAPSPERPCPGKRLHALFEDGTFGGRVRALLKTP